MKRFWLSSIVCTDSTLAVGNLQYGNSPGNFLQLTFYLNVIWYQVVEGRDSRLTLPRWKVFCQERNT